MVTPSATSCADDVPHRAAAARIQSRRRLVQEDDLGPADQRHRQIQLPAHAPGIGRHQLLRRLRQVEPLQQVRDDPLALAGAQTLEIRHQLQVLLARQQFVHRGELTGDPDDRAHRLGLGRDVVPGDAYRPAVGLHQRGQHVHRRRLARPIRAEQGKDRARCEHLDRCRRARSCPRTPFAALKLQSLNCSWVQIHGPDRHPPDTPLTRPLTRPSPPGHNCQRRGGEARAARILDLIIDGLQARPPGTQ